MFEQEFVVPAPSRVVEPLHGGPARAEEVRRPAGRRRSATVAQQPKVAGRGHGVRASCPGPGLWADTVAPVVGRARERGACVVVTPTVQRARARGAARRARPGVVGWFSRGLLATSAVGRRPGLTARPHGAMSARVGCHRTIALGPRHGCSTARGALRTLRWCQLAMSQAWIVLEARAGCGAPRVRRSVLLCCSPRMRGVFHVERRFAHALPAHPIGARSSPRRRFASPVVYAGGGESERSVRGRRLGVPPWARDRVRWWGDSLARRGPRSAFGAKARRRAVRCRRPRRVTDEPSSVRGRIANGGCPKTVAPVRSATACASRTTVLGMRPRIVSRVGRRTVTAASARRDAVLAATAVNGCAPRRGGLGLSRPARRVGRRPRIAPLGRGSRGDLEMAGRVSRETAPRHAPLDRTGARTVPTCWCLCWYWCMPWRQRQGSRPSACSRGVRSSVMCCPGAGMVVHRHAGLAVLRAGYESLRRLCPWDATTQAADAESRSQVETPDGSLRPRVPRGDTGGRCRGSSRRCCGSSRSAAVKGADTDLAGLVRPCLRFT